MRSSSRGTALGLVIAVAVLIRLFLGWQVAHGPLAELHRWSQSDMQYFHAWAARIADGDWLSRNVDPPLHEWHLAVARTCLDRHPDLRRLLAAEFGPEIAVRESERCLWTHWLGPGVFYQEPAYPYFVALCYRLAGAVPLHVLFLQMALGVGSAVLMFRIAARHGGSTVGLLAGLIMASYGPALAQECLLLRESMIVFTSLLLADLTELCLARDRPGWWWGLGLLLGLALLVKMTLLLFLAGVVLWVAVRARKELRAGAVRLACLSAGLALVFSPLIARNILTGVAPVAVCSSGGFNLLHFARPEAGLWDPSAVSLDSLPELMHRTGGRLVPALKAAWDAYPDASSIAKAAWQRFDAAWHWWERPDNGNLHSTSLFAPVLKWLPVSFASVAPLALLGMLLLITSWRRHVILYLLVAAALVPLLVFGAVGRFRLPLAVASIPFAAFSLQQIGYWLRDGAWRRAAAAAAAAALLLPWTGRALPAGVAVVRETDIIAVFQAGCVPELNADAQAGRFARAAERIERFLDQLRGIAWPMAEDAFWRTDDGVRLAAFIADRHEDCATLRLQCGQAQAARRHQDAVKAWRLKAGAARL
jgi:4-amino-4-deoxy-L-arabinose transferase-like glycosyltransferase